MAAHVWLLPTNPAISNQPHHLIYIPWVSQSFDQTRREALVPWQHLLGGDRLLKRAVPECPERSASPVNNACVEPPVIHVPPIYVLYSVEAGYM